MDQKIISTSRYEYAHEIGEWPSKVVDFHCVRVLRRSNGLVKTIRQCSSIAVVVLFVALMLIGPPFILIKDESAFFILGCFFTLAMLLRSVLGKQVDKASFLVTKVAYLQVYDIEEMIVKLCELPSIFTLCGQLLFFVVTESVVILPAFGVQLETHYVSGRVIRRFVPIDKILKSVLNECVTPVTCYWSLALLLHGEDELMLVFKELHPPLKMLAPIWRALCAATNSEET